MLSSNVAVDLLKSPEPPKAKLFQDHANILHRLCFRAQDTLPARSPLSPIYLQAKQAIDRAFDHIKEVNKLFKFRIYG